jgi:hypothetical protein
VQQRPASDGVDIAPAPQSLLTGAIGLSAVERMDPARLAIGNYPISKKDRTAYAAFPPKMPDIGCSRARGCYPIACHLFRHVLNRDERTAKVERGLDSR